ncbi:chymotrypsinogen A-like isoform X2 [Dermacentor andersoni]|uniref:chymotrypsinogen A-like isoform X2 n=1 Tax=Dermacentor andersoni TaxID=34620 RepID=UPI002416F093|nr:serine protease 29-like isoform X4 [Dermacentor andersoni]
MEGMASLPCDYAPWYTQLYLTKGALVIFVMALPVTANKMDTNLNPAGCGKLGSKGRKYHGKPTSKENMPWVVQVKGVYDLSSGLASQCGGSIITKNLILTAAHCLFEEGAFALKVMVVYKSNLYNNGKALEAEKMMLHPKFVNKLGMVHDVALVKLAVDLEFNRMIKPVCLPTAKMDLAGKTLVVAGWGTTESNSSEILLHAEVVALPDDECQALLPRIIHPITRRRLHPGPAICASGENQGSCRGDSGGPLTLTNDDGRTLQVGVVSIGVSCPSNAASVYASVASHIKWIRRALNRPRKWRKLVFTRKEVNLG